MSTLFVRAAAVLPVAAIVLAVVLVTHHGDRGVIFHAVGVVVVAAILFVLVLVLRRSLHSTEPSLFEQALRGSHGQAPERPQQLAQLEREVGLGIANAFDLHQRLRPTLRETAAGLLQARRGIDLDAQPERAREVLGEDAWEIVRADRPMPIDRAARGADLATVDRLIAALEAL